MFVARDTGAQHYFKIPLAEALEIYNGAQGQVSGLARTARGPVMSATPGKVLVTGVSKVAKEEVFVLKFLQARDPDWVGKPFFARMDEEAAWLGDLKPAFKEEEFFFEPSFRQMTAGTGKNQDHRQTPPVWTRRPLLRPHRPGKSWGRHTPTKTTEA
jgi:hypothetical protein